MAITDKLAIDRRPQPRWHATRHDLDYRTHGIAVLAQPVEFLTAPWGAIGQWFPPGAAATLLRELSYFPRADTLFPWLVLAGWAVLGLLLSTLGHYRDRGAATQAALAAAE